MINPVQLVKQIDFTRSIIAGIPTAERTLADLNGYFIDQVSFAAAVQANPVVYTLSATEFASGEGQLNCALATLMPGKVGPEYYFTKGHFHAWRPAAEIYLGLSGQGCLLLEQEDGQTNLLDLAPGLIVYVPGFTAHRTINTGTIPLTYLGIFPAQAGHDYATIAASNFQHVVVEIDGQPRLVDRTEYLAQFTAA